MATVPEILDQMWGRLLQTTITGKQYLSRGQPVTGAWGDAKKLLQQAKDTAGPLLPSDALYPRGD